MSGNWERSTARYNLEENFGSQMHDEEMNELIADLCAYGRYETQDEAGVLMALEYWQAGDWQEEDYRKAVQRFKQKWFHRTPKNRIEFYQDKLQEHCDKLKLELNWCDESKE